MTDFLQISAITAEQGIIELLVVLMTLLHVRRDIDNQSYTKIENIFRYQFRNHFDRQMALLNCFRNLVDRPKSNGFLATKWQKTDILTGM